MIHFRMNQVWKNVANFAICKINDDDIIFFTSKVLLKLRISRKSILVAEKFLMSYLGHILLH